MIPTTEKLALALEALEDPALTNMVKLARDGYYDDFKSTIIYPLRQLVDDLRAAGYPEMALQVVDGKFDSTIEESAEWMIQEGWSWLLNDLR